MKTPGAAGAGAAAGAAPPKLGNEADLVAPLPAPNVLASDFKAEPKEKPELGAAGVVVVPPPNLKMSAADEDAPGAAVLPKPKAFGCSAVACDVVDDEPNWKSEADLAGSASWL